MSNETKNKDSFKSIQTTFDGDGSIKKQSSPKSFWPKIMSVVAAFVLWLYVFQVAEYEKPIKGIPIVIENFDSSLGLEIVNDSFPDTLDITFSGTKSEIDRIDTEKLRAVVDLSSVREAKTYNIKIEIENPPAEIVEKSIDQINIKVDKRISKEFQVQTELGNTATVLPYSLGEPVLMNSTVVLTGPETDIMKVDRVVVMLDTGTVKNEMTLSRDYVLLDRNNQKIETKYIATNPLVCNGIVVPVYKKQTVGVVPNIKINETKYEYAFSPSKVVLYGTVNSVEAITEITTSPITVSESGVYELELLLPEGIKAYRSDNMTESTLVENATLTVREIPPATVLPGNTETGAEGLNNSKDSNDVAVIAYGEDDTSFGGIDEN